jgi:acyl carrier protein
VVSDKQPLGDSGNDQMLAHLDSMVIVALISMIEGEFSITIEDEEIELEMFESFEALAGFVESKV